MMWFACGPILALKRLHTVHLCLHFSPRLYFFGHCFVFAWKSVKYFFFAWQAIHDVEVKCLTYLAISHVINSYIIFFFYFQLLKFKYAWNVKVAWNWSDARMFNVPLRTCHFLAGKIWGEFPALSSDTNPLDTNYGKTIWNLSAVSRVINSEAILLSILRMYF